MPFGTVDRRWSELTVLRTVCGLVGSGQPASDRVAVSAAPSPSPPGLPDRGLLGGHVSSTVVVAHHGGELGDLLATQPAGWLNRQSARWSPATQVIPPLSATRYGNGAHITGAAAGTGALLRAASARATATPACACRRG
jgi:hypothetical protein